MASLSMQLEDEQLERMKRILLDSAPRHVGTVIYKSKQSGARRCASCVFVAVGGKQYAVTSAHVTTDASELFILAISPSAEPQPFGPVTYLTPALVLKEDAQADIAVVSADSFGFDRAKKLAYPLAESGFLMFDVLKRQLGLLAFIYGTFGAKAELTDISDHTYVEVPMYGGWGGIKTVAQDSITAEFKEEKAELCDVNLFPQLKDVKASGASRDLGGMSGSGLWVADDRGIVLAGILKGPASEITGDPEIRFVPIWAVRSIFEQLTKTNVQPNATT